MVMCNLELLVLSEPVSPLVKTVKRVDLLFLIQRATRGGSESVESFENGGAELPAGSHHTHAFMAEDLGEVREMGLNFTQMRTGGLGEKKRKLRDRPRLGSGVRGERGKKSSKCTVQWILLQ